MGFFSNFFNSKSKDETSNQVVDKNIQSELDKLIAQAESGDVNSQVILANKYFNGEGLKQDKKEAVKWYRLAADRGHAGAQTAMGIFYSGAHGLFEPNIEIAFQYFMKAANQGDATAQWRIGDIYLYQNNLVEAEKWLTMSLNNGEQSAIIGLADVNMRQGRKEEAVKLLTKSASLGNPLAMNNLGFCYQNGQGVHMDKEIAVYWYQKAVDGNYDLACQNLAICYRDGIGVEKNPAKMVEILQKGVQLGNAFCMYQLGIFYKQGIPGVIPMNMDRATELINKAIMLGYKE